MDVSSCDLGGRSRLRLLLDHFSLIEDTREPHGWLSRWRSFCCWRCAGQSPIATTMTPIGLWGDTINYLRRFLPYHHGVPSGRWLTIMMNRINPALFSACFTSWVRACWPDRPDLVAIDGKTSRRSHDRGQNRSPLHLGGLSLRHATTVWCSGRRAVAGKSNELTAIPISAAGTGWRPTAVSRARS